MDVLSSRLSGPDRFTATGRNRSLARKRPRGLRSSRAYAFSEFSAVARTPFKPLRQFLVSRDDCARLLPNVRLMEGLGAGQDLFGACSQVLRQQ
jgi:hypothetical protein